MPNQEKWSTRFITVALGQAVSLLGSHGVQFALIWWLAEQTSSPLMLGLSGLAAYLPMTLFSPLAGISGTAILFMTAGVLLAYYAKSQRRRERV